MLLRDAIEAKLKDEERAGSGRAGSVRLPRSLKSDPVGARVALLQRLAASRLFAQGNRAGVLKAAARRSGTAFRLDVRQSVIVKALVSRHVGRGGERGAALARHVVYLGRSGAGQEGTAPEFFDRSREALDPLSETVDWSGDRHHFRLIISPEHGDRLADLRGYVRDVMSRVMADLGQPDHDWVATCHFDTAQPHAHVLVRGKKANGSDLVIPRDYIAYGIRGRAQEVAQERLGDLSRADAERRVWRQTEAERFTGLDRRLIAASDAEGRVADGIGKGPWNALSRGRLRNLEKLGLASPVGAGYRLAPDLEARLRRLQLDKDVIRTLHERRMQGARQIRVLGTEPVIGRVVRAGHHDELGASPFVVVRDSAGVEHYARVRTGTMRAEVGQRVQMSLTTAGVTLQAARGRDSAQSLG